MMSGIVWAKGDARMPREPLAHGGLLVIDGNASGRCGISMKGIDIVVKGSVGHISAFMAQAGNLVVLRDAGEALGDSIYEAHLYVRGKPSTAWVPIASKNRWKKSTSSSCGGCSMRRHERRSGCR